MTLAPLTLFTGANSAGKSTVIQSILLTAQTVQSTLQSRAVVLNGHITRLGTFRDVVSHDANEPTILIGFELDVAPEAYAGRYARMTRRRLVRPLHLRGREVPLHVDCSFTFSARSTGEQSELLQLQPELEHSRISADTSNDDGPATEFLEFGRSSKSVDDRARLLQLADDSQGALLLDTLRWEVLSRRGDIPAPFARVQGRDVGVSVNHFLPESLSVVFDAVEEEVKLVVGALTSSERRFADPTRERLPEIPEAAQRLIREAVLDVAREFEERSPESILSAPHLTLREWVTRLEGAGPTDLVATLARLQRYVPAPVQVAIGNRLLEKRDLLRDLLRAGRRPRMEMRYVPLPETVGTAVDAVQYYFSEAVRYLGPLRDEPKAIYPLSAASDTRDVGFRGEHTAAVLDIHRNSDVLYLRAPEDAVHSATPEVAPLIEAVLHWLRYMGVGSEVTTRDRGKLGHDLRVAATGSGALHDLTHVGVGVSQVLPILVLSLLAGSGSTLIFEQPELHLHPRVQTRLADFFVSMTQLGKQCIVETHSEYLINRLRYRAATADGDKLARDVVMYFVEKPEGESLYREVRINEYGVIEDWPRGFFDENEEVAADILRAGMRKRRALSRGDDA